MWSYTEDEQEWLRSRNVEPLHASAGNADIADHIVRARALRSEVISRALREILSNLHSGRLPATEQPRPREIRAA